MVSWAEIAKRGHEKSKIEERIEQSVKIIQAFCTIGIAKTMSNFNGKQLS